MMTETKAPSSDNPEASSSGTTQMSITMEQLNAIIQSAVQGALAALPQAPAAASPVQQNTQRPIRPSIGLDCNEGR